MTTSLIRSWTTHLTPPTPGWQRTDPLDAGLIAEWPLNHPTGLIMPDFAGRTIAADVVGANWVSTQYGPALKFTQANSDYAITKDIQSYLDGLAQISFLVFLQFTADIDTNAALLGFITTASGGTATTGFQVTDHQDRIVFGVTAGATFVSSYFPYMLRNTWYHIAGVYDGTRTRLYIDGAQVASDVQTGSVDATGAYDRKIRLGTAAWPSTYIDFTIAYAAIYRRALSPAQVALHHLRCRKRANPMTRTWTIPRGTITAPPPPGWYRHMAMTGVATRFP